MRILVVEDNPRMAAAIGRGLEAQGYVVDACGSGHDAEELALSGAHDLIVLDRMLPDRDGVELCRSLRRQGIATPVLVLTALSSTAEKVSGLDAGADDYLGKPFEFEELLARVRALLRRGRATEAVRLEHGSLVIDLLRRSVTREGRPVQLSAREFALLEFLARNPERVLDRMTIAQKVWDMTYEPSSNVIDVYISQLRRKIDRGAQQPLIHTVVGVGYRFGLEGEAPRVEEREGC